MICQPLKKTVLCRPVFSSNYNKRDQDTDNFDKVKITKLQFVSCYTKGLPPQIPSIRATSEKDCRLHFKMGLYLLHFLLPIPLPIFSSSYYISPIFLQFNERIPLTSASLCRAYLSSRMESDAWHLAEWIWMRDKTCPLGPWCFQSVAPIRPTCRRQTYVTAASRGSTSGEVNQRSRRRRLGSPSSLAARRTRRCHLLLIGVTPHLPTSPPPPPTHTYKPHS